MQIQELIEPLSKVITVCKVTSSKGNTFYAWYFHIEDKYYFIKYLSNFEVKQLGLN